MTPQEIITEIQKLPPIKRKKVLEGISQNLLENNVISEAEAAKRLLKKGIITEIPEGWNESDEDFEPIEIKGKPLSETIIEDRRYCRLIFSTVARQSNDMLVKSARLGLLVFSVLQTKVAFTLRELP